MSSSSSTSIRGTKTIIDLAGADSHKAIHEERQKEKVGGIGNDGTQNEKGTDYQQETSTGWSPYKERNRKKRRSNTCQREARMDENQRKKTVHTAYLESTERNRTEGRAADLIHKRKQKTGQPKDRTVQKEVRQRKNCPRGGKGYASLTPLKAL